jgi:hypothetical protein
MIRAAGLAIFLAQPALACAVQESFFPPDIAALPVVVLADVAGYSRSVTGDGTLLLDVAEVWKGAAPDRVRALWQITMADLPPENWDGRPTRILAGLIPETEGDGFLLFVEMCGSAHLVEATEANLAAVKAALP